MLLPGDTFGGFPYSLWSLPQRLGEISRASPYGGHLELVINYTSWEIYLFPRTSLTTVQAGIAAASKSAGERAKMTKPSSS